MTDKIVSKPDYATAIITLKGEPKVIENAFQKFFDDIQFKWNDRIGGDFLKLETYTVATLPPVPLLPTIGLIGVSDETGGPTLAFSNGVNWLRTLDNAIVS